MELGVAVSRGRPYHPQTQGKDERFHRTLAAEAIGRRRFADLAECQRRFDAWRQVYNSERPHEALGLPAPIARYRPSRRTFPERIEPFDYGPGAVMRGVNGKGHLRFDKRAAPPDSGRSRCGRRSLLWTTGAGSHLSIISPNIRQSSPRPLHPRPGTNE
jgi:hypothetical protein